MADIPASTWSETDADNNTAAPLGFPEGMAPSGINNGARAVMGAVKRWFNWTIPKTTGGTSTAYTVSYSVAPGALVDGMSHLVLFHTASGSSPTVNVNSLGAKPLYYFNGSAWAQITTAGAIPANFLGRLSYNQSDGAYRLTSMAYQLGAALLTVANTFSALLTMSGAAINEAKGSDIASATTTDIGAATGNYVRVTGTTTITGLGTIQAGVERTVTFTGALTLTHNATSLILMGGANILTAAGDSAIFRSLGSGNWECITYTRRAYTPGGGQIVTLLSGAVDSTSSAIPADDTKPQNNEGKEFLSLAITPKSATSKLYVDVVLVGSVDTPTAYFVASLFQDAGADALATSVSNSAFAGAMGTIAFSYSMTSGTTSATTFKVRAGPTSGIFTFNGTGGLRFFGGVMGSSITIREVI